MQKLDEFPAFWNIIATIEITDRTRYTYAGVHSLRILFIICIIQSMEKKAYSWLTALSAFAVILGTLTGLY